MTEPQNSATTAAFRGIWPALLTPLNADLSIDHAKLAAHCKSLIARGCPGVTPFGTTGEGPSFSTAERKEANQRIYAANEAAAVYFHGLLMNSPNVRRYVAQRGVTDDTIREFLLQTQAVQLVGQSLYLGDSDINLLTVERALGLRGLDAGGAR